MKTLNILLLSLFITSAALAGDNHQLNYLKTDLPEGHFEAATYLPLKTDVKAILILTPTIAGVSILEKINASYFSKNGFLVIMPLPFDDEIDSVEPDIAKLDAAFLKPAIAADKFITMAEERFKLPANLPVFALGASQGGFRTLIIASHSERVKAAWFATAGGDFASVYAYSTVKKISEFKNRHMKFLGMTDVKEYETYLRNNLKNDPVNACKDIKIPFVQTMTMKDDKVPTANQQVLVDNCPAHEVIRLNTGHVVGSMSTVKWRKRIMAFFLKSI